MPAETVIGPGIQQSGAMVSALISAVQSKQWGLVAGGALSLCVVLLRVALPNLTGTQVKLASALMATLPTVAVVLGKPGVSMADVVATSVQSVLLASGLWSMVLKDAGVGQFLDKRAAPAPEKVVP